MSMAASAVPHTKLVPALAQALKGVPEIKPPAWATSVKSGSHAERVPEQEDYWFLRCGALLRTLYLNSESVGVRRLRNKFGGRIVHTVSRSHHRKAGGKGIRLALQQLEKAGLVKKEKVGRVLSASGRKLINKVALQFSAASGKPAVSHAPSAAAA